MRLTKSKVENAPIPASGATLSWDADLPGFGLRVTAGGSRSYIAQGRVRGRTRRVTLGRHGILTAEQARKKAKKVLGDMADGHDPVAERKRRTAVAVTLRDVAEDYIENKRRKSDGKPLADRSKADIRRHLRASFDGWADKPIASIDRDKVARKYKELAGRSHAQANQAMRIMSALVNYARGRHRGPSGELIIADNPVAVIHESGLYRGDVPGRKTRVPLESVGKFYAELEATRTDPDESPSIRVKATAAVVLMLTGLRKADVVGRAWADVDLDDASLHVPDTKHRSPRTFPLAEQVVDVLRDLKEITGESDYIFAGEGKKVPTIYDVRDGMARACTAIEHHVTAHDLRRTWIDVCNVLDIDPLIAELLSNRKGAAYQALSTRFESYDTSDLTHYADRVQRIADYYDEQRRIADADNVIPMEARVG